MMALDLRDIKAMADREQREVPYYVPINHQICKYVVYPGGRVKDLNGNTIAVSDNWVRYLSFWEAWAAYVKNEYPLYNS